MGEDPYTATDTVDAYADGYDAGQSAIWEKIVCSVCGHNHDAEESAACEGCEPIPFVDWIERVHEERLTRESGLALVAEANRFDRAYQRERERLFNLRRGIRLAVAQLPATPDRAQHTLERAYAADEEIEHEIQDAAGLPRVPNVEDFVKGDFE